VTSSRSFRPWRTAMVCSTCGPPALIVVCARCRREACARRVEARLSGRRVGSDKPLQPIAADLDIPTEVLRGWLETARRGDGARSTSSRRSSQRRELGRGCGRSTSLSRSTARWPRSSAGQPAISLASTAASSEEALERRSESLPGLRRGPPRARRAATRARPPDLDRGLTAGGRRRLGAHVAWRSSVATPRAPVGGHISPAAGALGMPVGIGRFRCQGTE
jgi:hypothetical protein